MKYTFWGPLSLKKCCLQNVYHYVSRKSGGEKANANDFYQIRHKHDARKIFILFLIKNGFNVLS